MPSLRLRVLSEMSRTFATVATDYSLLVENIAGTTARRSSRTATSDQLPSTCPVWLRSPQGQSPGHVEDVSVPSQMASPQSAHAPRSSLQFRQFSKTRGAWSPQRGELAGHGSEGSQAGEDIATQSGSEHPTRPSPSMSRPPEHCSKLLLFCQVKRHGAHQPGRLVHRRRER